MILFSHYLHIKSTLNSNGQPNENSKSYYSGRTLGCYHLFYLSILFWLRGTMFKNKNFKIAIEFLLAGVAFGVGRYIGLVFWERIILFFVLYGLFELVLWYAKKK